MCEIGYNVMGHQSTVDGQWGRVNGSGFGEDDGTRNKLADWPSIHVNYRYIACIISKFAKYDKGPTILSSTYAKEASIITNPG